MSDTITVARPYAKALFEFALESKQLSDWSYLLELMTHVVMFPAMVEILKNPATTNKNKIDLLMSVALENSGVDDQLATNLVNLLVANKRVLYIPEIYLEYMRLRAEQEKTLTVNVRTFSPMTESQKNQLIEKLTKRLQRQVHLELQIDESLLGGALIQAGDLVIDGSVRGQLSKLEDALVEKF